MSDYAAYFLNSPASAVPLDTLEISHPNFSEVYRLVRNAEQGLTARLETGELADFDYRPIRIRNLGSTDDLEQAMRIDLGDLGEIVPFELDRVAEMNGWAVKPTVIYRLYRSDDLEAPLLGPVKLEAGAFSFKKEGCSFEARAPSLNINRTGELYRIARFPMMAGFI